MARLAVLSVFLMLLGALPGLKRALKAEVLPGQGNPPAWDTMSDTWAATDGLGRVLPTATQAGPPRKDRWVGVFYFLSLIHI